MSYKTDYSKLSVVPDTLLMLSLSNAAPQVFVGYAGTVSAGGLAQARVQLPQVAALIGLTVQSAFVTLHAPSPFGVKSVSNPFSFKVIK